jgi:hypothetical protein
MFHAMKAARMPTRPVLKPWDKVNKFLTGVNPAMGSPKTSSKIAMVKRTQINPVNLLMTSDIISSNCMVPPSGSCYAPNLRHIFFKVVLLLSKNNYIDATSIDFNIYESQSISIYGSKDGAFNLVGDT